MADPRAFSEPNEEAFFAAGRAVVDDCERLFAVWDGRQAKASVELRT